MNRVRWQSLKTGKAGNATVATLFKAVIDAGRGDLIPSSHTSARDDFDDDIEDDHQTSVADPRPVIRYAEHKLPENLDQAEARHDHCEGPALSDAGADRAADPPRRR